MQVTSRYNRYSLIEIIVVLVMIGMILGIVLPRIGFVPQSIQLSQTHGSFRSAFSAASTMAAATNHIVAVQVDLQNHLLTVEQVAPAAEILKTVNSSLSDENEQEPMGGIYESFREFPLPADLKLNTVLVEEPEDPAILRYVFYPSGEASGLDIPFDLNDFWFEVKVDKLSGKAIIRKDDDH